ncbi:cache domain-containing sensor histidine kinase [Paenibacillus soyae]|uniref:Sensor histidine kinase n=1 Tax=Paenibacillus soyae TaxID=2969249 RepID=A0A9X2MTX6_9BACL|nr:sensor histidine kinase [Paenibacillus soyae]MCR2806415.1 sensor histidine kinase [Paenibacillus soyae]
MLANILLVFIPVIAMGALSYFKFSDAIESKSSHFYSISLLETDRKLKFALSEITTITSSAMTQPVIQQALKNPNQIPSYDMKQEINNLLIHHPMIEAFAFYAQNRLVYSYNMQDALTDLRRQPWHAKMEAAEGRPVWSGPEENGSAAAGRPALVHARIVKDYYSLENIGSIVIYMKPDLLDQVFWETATLEKGNILLASRDGSIVYDKSGEHIGERVDFPFLQEGVPSEKNYYIDRYLNVKSLITFIPSHNPEWRLIAITPTKSLQAESIPLRNTALLLGVFSLLTALAFDRFYVRRLVRSISSTVGGMRRVEQRNFTLIPGSGQPHDESDMLVHGFNRMSSQIQDLLKQVEAEQSLKKEAELQALVAQINPHFIYNSLESINSMAVLQGNKDISRMVVSLGRLLRISISENKELIPLSTEFEHVRHYLNIQKFRFEDQFEYELDLPEQLGGYMTQKLIVQPLVENALYHAIEPMKMLGKIRIRASEGANELWIDVIDNGPGFDASVLASLWDRDYQAEVKKYKDSGVGLRNVHERLRIRFGQPYGMMICSSPETGSIIRLRVPKIKP